MMTDNKRKKLPRPGTIARKLLDYLAAAGPKGRRFNDLRHMYCEMSPAYRAMTGSYMRRGFFERCSMTIMGFLPGYATKQGKPGSSAPWVFTFDPKAGTLEDPAHVERIMIEQVTAIIRGLSPAGKAEVAIAACRLLQEVV